MVNYAFDVEEFVRQLRAANAAAIKMARETITDPISLAGAEAQSALLPAHENWVRVHIGLREAGRSDGLIAAVGGALAGAVLRDLLLNCADPELAEEIFMRAIEQSLSGRNTIGARTIGVLGVPGGRA